jgi:hypothetical protein
MFLVPRDVNKFSPDLRAVKLYLAVTCRVEIFGKEEKFELKKLKISLKKLRASEQE